MCLQDCFEEQSSGKATVSSPVCNCHQDNPEIAAVSETALLSTDACCDKVCILGISWENIQILLQNLRFAENHFFTGRLETDTETKHRET